MSAGQANSQKKFWWRSGRRAAAIDPVESLSRAEIADFLCTTTQPGDLVLSGSRDSLSRCIRWGTMSDFSHVAVALGGDHLIESYDWSGTPSQRDGGVAQLDIQRYAKRGSLLHLAVLRPKDLDLQKFAEISAHATNHSPPFPSSTGVLLAFAGLGDHPKVTVPGARRYVEKRLHLLGDGAARVTCAEFAARLYLDCGVTLRFQTLRLLSYVELLCHDQPQRLQAHTTPRQVHVAEDAKAKPTTLFEFVAGFHDALAENSIEPTSAPDWVDLLMPGDFLRSSTFDLVARRSVQK